MKHSAAASARLQKLYAERTTADGDIRIRHGFIRLSSPDATDTTDSELVLLLITARTLDQHGDAAQPLPSGARKPNYGLSRDSFEAAHRILDYLDIVDVISDYQRSADGKVDGFKDRGAKPHLLRFHPEALDRPAYPTIMDTLAEQIARSEKGEWCQRPLPWALAVSPAGAHPDLQTVIWTAAPGPTWA